MTTSKGLPKTDRSPVLVASEWDDYAIISRLTDEEHRLPDWVLRVVSGRTRFIQGMSDTHLMDSALAHMTHRKENAQDVEAQWRNYVDLQEIGLRQVIREYQNKREANGVEEGDQSS